MANLRSMCSVLAMGMLFGGVTPICAQNTTARTRLVVGLSVGAFIESPPGAGPFTNGVVLGIERTARSGFTVRGMLINMKVNPLGDDARVCRPTPDGCAYPVFPDWLVSAELQALVPSWQGSPLRLVAGTGIATAIGGRENAPGAPLSGILASREYQACAPLENWFQ